MHRENPHRTALFALGFIATGTQVYFIREVMMVLNDNELVIGLALALWMSLTGFGAWLGRFRSGNAVDGSGLILLLPAVGIMPPFMITGVALLKTFMIATGCMAGFWQIALISLILLTPFCLLNGFLFTQLCRFPDSVTPGKAYAIESLGSMVSGALVNAVFLWVMGPFKGMFLLCFIYLALVNLFAWRTARHTFFRYLLAFSLIFLIVTGLVDFRALTVKWLYPGQQTVSVKETPWGQVVITRSGPQLNYFENGMLLFSSGNSISNEESVHYAMVQHPKPSTVLLISGGFSGTLSEILKYHPARVDYCELNPALIRIAADYTRQLDCKLIFVHETDARRYLRKDTGSWDVVLVNLPAPGSIQLNRYYSAEFISEVRAKLQPGGILAFNLPTSGDYLSDRAGRFNAIMWKTLRGYFKEVLIVPGGRNYYIASDGPLSLDIPAMIEAKGIETVYVNRYYIDAGSLQERSEEMMNVLDGPTTRSLPANRDFTPAASFYFISWWLVQTNTSVMRIFIVFAILLCIMLITLNPLSAGLFTAGFTLASTEIIMIFGIQVLCGFIFQAIGWVFMVFMLGLAAGSVRHPRSRKAFDKSRVPVFQVLLGLIALLFPAVLYGLQLHRSGDILVMVTCSLLAFAAAYIAGRLYTLTTGLSRKPPGRRVAGNYSAELFGSASGAFATSFVLLPVYGIVNTAMILAFLNGVIATVIWMTRRTHGPA